MLQELVVLPANPDNICGFALDPSLTDVEVKAIMLLERWPRSEALSQRSFRRLATFQFRTG